MSEEQNQLIMPVEQKAIDFYGDEVIAVAAEVEGERQVFVPIRPIAERFGLNWSGQLQRIKRHAVMGPALGVCVIHTPSGPGGKGGGPQEMICLPLEYLPGWLFGIETGRITDDKLREAIIRYQRECFRVLWEAFQTETLARREAPGTLAQVRATALAVATLAEQQMLLESDVIEAKELGTSAHARLDKAAGIFKAFDQRLSTVEQRLAPATHITEEQAAEIAALVKALAELLTAHDPSKNHYQGVFGELYRRFGVNSYKNIRQGQYEAVLAFLEDWRQAADQERGEI